LPVTGAQIGFIILGTIFIFIGLVACAIGAIRHRSGARILISQGIFSLMYGARLLAGVPAVFGLLPGPLDSARVYVISLITYLIMVPAIVFWFDLSLGLLRRFVQILLIAACALASAGVFFTFLARDPLRIMPFNNLLAIVILLVLAVVNAVPSLAKKFLVVPSRVAEAGTLLLAAAALYENLRDFLHLPYRPFLEPLAFLAFVLSLVYVAAEKIFADERRLLAVEDELAIARQIQASILPAAVPALKDLRITAAYRPMTAVAGDFYEFIPVDSARIGFLVADVSGHGVPAALIASMIKIAMQSVVSCAHDPREVLRGLNRILSAQLRDQFVSIAYLWLDLEIRQALYSAAGHPPLLLWRAGKLDRIESNGLLVGVVPDPDFPVCGIPIRAGDRFLLYTDGVIEPENARGDSFGSHKLEQVIRGNQSRPPSGLLDQLLAEIRNWQPASTPQQDDITLVLVDVL
jgi:phosphoserine phosphatase RsbU/P